MSCIDIIVIRQPDGTFRTSPFYVRFDYPKLQKTTVSIEVNECKVNVSNFVVEAGDYHSRFIHDQPTVECPETFWPIYQTWEITKDVTTLTEEARKTFSLELQDRILPRSETIAQLNLKNGVNTVKFTLDENQSASARIFLWDWSQRLVVSDVDGTITGTGEVLSRFSEYYTNNYYISHARPGITQLYSNIEKNGYKVFYMTGRPILQSSMMRDFISKIKQEEDYNMPEGPVITTPFRTYISRAFKVWRGQPDEYKTSMLKCIRNLFPETTKDPLIAGFGNTENRYYFLYERWYQSLNVFLCE